MNTKLVQAVYYTIGRHVDSKQPGVHHNAKQAKYQAAGQSKGHKLHVDRLEGVRKCSRSHWKLELRTKNPLQDSQLSHSQMFLFVLLIPCQSRLP
jgi:hypothetical protein